MRNNKQRNIPSRQIKSIVKTLDFGHFYVVLVFVYFLSFLFLSCSSVVNVFFVEFVQWRILITFQLFQYYMMSKEFKSDWKLQLFLFHPPQGTVGIRFYYPTCLAQA